MGFLKKLFGGTAKSEAPKAGGPKGSPSLINQSDTGPPLRVDTSAISHAFVALTHADMSHSDRIAKDIIKFNRHCQPRLWSVDFKVKCVAFAVNAMENGFPDGTSVGPALESQGLKAPYSLVINTVTISLDGGRTPTKILAGFAYRDPEPKIVLPRSDGCVPA
jgi:hypothetical protein